MPVTNTSNYTTLYSTTAGAIAPQQPYGNANVEAFLNVGTDGGNTVQNIVANGTITANGNIESNGYFVGDGGYLSNVTAAVFNANTVDVSNANVNTNLNYYPVFANSAGNVVMNIDDGNTTLTYNPFTGTLTANTVQTSYLKNGGGEDINLDGTNNSIRMSVTGGSNAVVISNSLANFNIPITANGNITTNNTIVANSANLANTYTIDSDGFYFPIVPRTTMPTDYNPEIIGYSVGGNATLGSNVITNIVLRNAQGAAVSLTGRTATLVGSQVTFNNQVGGGIACTDEFFPLGTTIASVDEPNATFTMSNVATATGNLNVLRTGGLISNASTNTYFLMSQAYCADATATSSVDNKITVNNITWAGVIPTAGGVGQPVQFLGATGFGGITPNTTYYTNSIDFANSKFTISTSSTGSPILPLTTGTGNLTVVFPFNGTGGPSGSQNPIFRAGIGFSIKPTTSGYYFAGPWPNATLPITSFADSTGKNVVGNIAFVATTAPVKPVDFNSNNISGNAYAGQFNRFIGPVVATDGPFGVGTLNGQLIDSFASTGTTTFHAGVDANLAGIQTRNQIIYYSDNGTTLNPPAINNLNNPPTFGITSFFGNANSPTANLWARSGFPIGRISFTGSQNVGNTQYIPPGSTPHAGIYVQALGDWNDVTNTSLPMVMAFQYSPLNAQTDGGIQNYQRINRTFLQAANNTTSIGGATTVEFKPLPRTNNATNNRAPSALGNVTTNPQTWANIGGYVQGNAVSNAQGSLLNVTTTDNNQNGNVAVRLSRTVGSTGNMEFQLPQGISNTLVLRDVASGSNIATFTNTTSAFTGNITANNATLNNVVANTVLLSYTNNAADRVMFTTSVSNTASGKMWVSEVDNPQTEFGITDLRFARYTDFTNMNNWQVYRTRGTSASRLPVQTNDTLFSQAFDAYGDSGNTFVNAGSIRLTVKNNDLAGNVDCNFNINGGSGGTNNSNLVFNHFSTANFNSANVSAGSFSTANTNIYANGAINTNGELTADNVKIDTNGFMKLASYTAAGLNAITGQIGWMAAVSDSAGGGNPNGMIAFWDTTNARWSYVHDNSAV